MKFILLFFFMIGVYTTKSLCCFVIPKDSIKEDSLILYAKKYIGSNYKYGSYEPSKGFDCSGFVYYIFTHFKVKVPRSSIDYATAGKTIHPDSFKVGDVIVFTGTNVKNRTPGHVGIIVSNAGEELQFIHSSSNKKHSGVKLSTYKESPYYEKRFLKIVRVAQFYR
ncbi:MAG: C40 family peptidase [Bacteroidetes bacterium]|nr:C40 family peptidase [Bacteroidota bacterium]